MRERERRRKKTRNLKKKKNATRVVAVYESTNIVYKSNLTLV